MRYRDLTGHLSMSLGTALTVGGDQTRAGETVCSTSVGMQPGFCAHADLNRIYGLNLTRGRGAIHRHAALTPIDQLA
jgi:hypothetical protein